MAQMTMKCVVRIAPGTIAAYAADLERHLLKYGPEPAPHLRKQAAADMERMDQCLRDCMEVEIVS